MSSTEQAKAALGAMTTNAAVIEIASAKLRTRLDLLGEIRVLANLKRLAVTDRFPLFGDPSECLNALGTAKCWRTHGRYRPFVRFYLRLWIDLAAGLGGREVFVVAAGARTGANGFDHQNDPGADPRRNPKDDPE